MTLHDTYVHSIDCPYSVLVQYYGVHCYLIYRNYIPGKLTCGLFKCKTFNINTFLWYCFRQLYPSTLLTYICDI